MKGSVNVDNLPNDAVEPTKCEISKPEEGCHSCAANDDDTNVKSDPPIIIKNAFNPKELLGCEPKDWITVLRSIAPKLPVQVHCEPFNIRDGPSMDSPPIFRNACKFLETRPEFKSLMKHELNNGDPSQARIKLRIGMSGKFIHRNRETRKQILLCLEGKQKWLFLSSYGGESDKLLKRATNTHWCGYRSAAHPSMLTKEQMQDIVNNLPEGVDHRYITFKAGDAMAFDARWWHGTSYNNPVFLMFFTPGEDMIEAVSEHKVRHGRPSHQVFKLCSVSMAKTAKLADTWKKDETGKDINWEATEGHVVLNQ